MSRLRRGRGRIGRRAAVDIFWFEEEEGGRKEGRKWLGGKEEQMTSFILRNGFGSRRRQQPVPWRERSKFSERLLGRA